MKGEHLKRQRAETVERGKEVENGGDVADGTFAETVGRRPAKSREKTFAEGEARSQEHRK